MKKLTREDLQDAKGAKVDDVLRFEAPKGRLKFIASAFYDNFFQSPAANICYLALLILGALSDFGKNEINRLPIAVFIVLVIKGLVVYYANKQYGSLRKAAISAVFDKDGFMQVASFREGGRYVRVTSDVWKAVETIRFYSDFLSIKIADNTRDGKVFFVMVDNSLQYRDAIASLWYDALTRSEDSLVLDHYSEREERELSEYIAEHFGAFNKVYHELIPLNVHIDIAMIPATPERNYITLCTIGAGAYRMSIPDDLRINNLMSEYAEYVMYLPADWKLDNESLKDEKNNWPVRILKETARMPIFTDSWLGYGHTVSPGDGELLVEGKPYDSVLLTCPMPQQDTLQYADLSSGKSVNFYQLHPITPEELEYKFDNTTSDFLAHIYPEGCDAVEIMLDRMN